LDDVLEDGDARAACRPFDTGQRGAAALGDPSRRGVRPRDPTFAADQSSPLQSADDASTAPCDRRAVDFDAAEPGLGEKEENFRRAAAPSRGRGCCTSPWPEHDEAALRASRPTARRAAPGIGQVRARAQRPLTGKNSSPGGCPR
jgi:hypothetical protein